MNYKDKLKNKVFGLVGGAADALGRECYVVGGYVRDLIIGRHSKDIDFVTVGSGIELAREVAERIGPKTHLAVYRTYGTAQVHHGQLELEFVGARKESYHRESRNPIVEDGTLDDDLSRRDFTINAMAISVNKDNFGELIDKFDGLSDIEKRVIRTPLDPDITFSDDPLRMMRAIRFATQLDFTIAPETLDAITRNAERITIITQERITTELSKIMRSPKPSIGWELLSDTGLLKIIFPELEALRGIQVVNGRGHKDNFYHTLQVLDTVAEGSDNEWLRWGALLHDIAKPVTRRYDAETGWTFHNHNFVGGKMVPRIFTRMKLPLGAEMRYVQKLVELHMRPIALVEDTVTDSAVRRLLNYAEGDIHDLMLLARADITSKNEAKKIRFLKNFDLVEEKFRDITAKDLERNRKPPVDGNEIMHIFGLHQSPLVGYFTKNLKQAIKDCDIEDNRDAALAYLMELAEKAGVPVVNPPHTDQPRAPESDSQHPE
ncbi:MAG: CCA tRNA nucleotidyltransferase [Muribaculaceae bacterium]|nr:CCA tRNA nucleotidyltransferase [Muribaculaceae bacterium]